MISLIIIIGLTALYCLFGIYQTRKPYRFYYGSWQTLKFTGNKEFPPYLTMKINSKNLGTKAIHGSSDELLPGNICTAAHNKDRIIR